MFSKYKSFIGLFLFVFFIAFIGIYIYQQNKDFQTHGPDVIDAATLPNIKFFDANNSTVHLNEIKAKAILVSFWASWCAPCLVELPAFEELNKKYADDGLVILPINLDDSSEEAFQFVKRFWQKEDLNFDTYYDFDKNSAQQLAVSGLPTNILINSERKIIFESKGLQDWKSDHIQKIIKESLN